MILLCLPLVDQDGAVEAVASFVGVPAGHAAILYATGRQEVLPLDDLPAHWLEQVRRAGRVDDG